MCGSEIGTFVILICRNEEKPYVTLTDEQKELFEKYSDSIREFHTIIDRIKCWSFTDGKCRESPENQWLSRFRW